MDNIEDYFQIFGLNSTASFEQVKQAYKDKIKSFANNRLSLDPKIRQEAQEKIQELNIAYEYIKKQSWDLYHQDLKEQKVDLKEEKHNHKKWFLPLIFFSFVAFASFTVYFLYAKFTTKTWEDIFSKSKDSVVVIKVDNSLGSGFIISSDGQIMTNAHVVDGYQEGKGIPIEVKLSSGEVKYAVIVKQGVPPLDVAILKIDGENYPSLTLPMAANCKEGEEIIAIGAPLGFDYSMTKGIISNCNRDFEGIKYIQTDTPLNSGNSGGPIITKKGEVIAISTGKIKAKGVEGLNFGLPIEVANDFVGGKLGALEATLREKREAEQRQLQAEINDFINRADKVYNILYNFYRSNYEDYNNLLNMKLRYRYISYENARMLSAQKIYPPSGFASIEEWLKSLTLRFMKNELSAKEAFDVIQGHFVDH